MSNQLSQPSERVQPQDRLHRERFIRPSYRVSENDEAFHVSITVPGVSKEGIELSLEEETLSILARRRSDDFGDMRVLSRELPTADYRLALSLNVRIKEDGIRAEVSNGILHLTLPKAEEVKPRRIAVN